MKKILLFSFLSIIIGVQSSAQTVGDAILFNSKQLHGSARYVGMGGAFTSLGNDFSGAYLNPAGIAVYRQSRLDFNFSFSNNLTDASYYGRTRSDANFNFLFENVGLVVKGGNPKKSKWSNFSFGMTYTKHADLNSRFFVDGTNTNDQTLGRQWFNNAQGMTPGQLEANGMFDELQAYESFIIDTSSQTNEITYENFILDGTTDQFYDFESSGNMSELGISFGGAYKNKFYYGIMLGFPSLTYFERTTFGESGFDANSFVNRFEYQNDLTLLGRGFNTRIGLIFNPIKFLRFAASYQSPSWYNVNVDFISSTNAFTDGGFFESTATNSRYSYGMTTPAVYRAGASLVIGKLGIISADYEFNDPSQTQLSGSPYLNDQALIQNFFQAYQTVKLGGELKLRKIYMRAGYQVRTNPIAGNEGLDETFFTATAGLGYRSESFGIDFALVNQETFTSFNTYETNSENIGLVTNRWNFIVGTHIRF